MLYSLDMQMIAAYLNQHLHTTHFPPFSRAIVLTTFSLFKSIILLIRAALPPLAASALRNDEVEIPFADENRERMTRINAEEMENDIAKASNKKRW